MPDDKAAIPREILRQASVAIENATRVVLVVDGARRAYAARSGTGAAAAPHGQAADSRREQSRHAAASVELAAPFYELGDEVFPVSAEHGYGVDELLDAITERNSQGRAANRETAVTSIIAIIGRPNVGKSTLLNRLVGAERSIVSAVPGTTRDAVDTVVERDGKAYRFVDTAGIRRKGKTKLVAEKLSVIMARRHLERADVALLVVDAAAGVTAHDANIAGYAEESGRSVIIVMNKWDLALEAAQGKHAGSEEERKAAARKARARAVEPPTNWLRGLRKAGARAIEISRLRADHFSFRDDRRAHRKALRPDRSRRRRRAAGASPPAS